jgi:hypothetical protein
MSESDNNTQSEFFNNLSKLIAKEYKEKDNVIVNLLKESDSSTVKESWKDNTEIITKHTISFTIVKKLK